MWSEKKIAVGLSENGGVVDGAGGEVSVRAGECLIGDDGDVGNGEVKEVLALALRAMVEGWLRVDIPRPEGENNEIKGEVGRGRYRLQLSSLFHPLVVCLCLMT